MTVQDAQSVKKAVDEMPDGIAQVHMNLADKQAIEGTLADFLSKACENVGLVLGSCAQQKCVRPNYTRSWCLHSPPHQRRVLTISTQRPH